jgi:hypothetical protein
MAPVIAVARKLSQRLTVLALFFFYFLQNRNELCERRRREKLCTDKMD